MSSGSPAWKNPRERLVKHSKRKSNRTLILSQPTTGTLDEFDTESCPPMTITAGRAGNPFKISSPRKKRTKLDEEEPLKEICFEWDDSTANDSFSTTATLKIQQATDSPKFSRSKSMQVFGEHSLDFSGMGSAFLHSSAENSPLTQNTKNSDMLPEDFRLGTKLRIISKVPFPWMKNSKVVGNVLVRMDGQDRSQGMQCFLDLHEDSSLIGSIPTNPTAFLEAASFYWQHPALPWLNLYPRIDSLLKNVPKQTAPPLAPTMTDMINKFESLGQLFISWKKGSRKSFYVVCPSFTVFFNKTKQLESEVDLTEDSVSCFQLADGQKHVAIISPTNLGFRQYLKSEGVDFSLCSYKRRRVSRIKCDESGLGSGDCSRLSAGAELSSETRDSSIDAVFTMEKENDENSVESAAESDHELESPTKGTSDVHEWLEDIGVSPRNQLKMKRHKSMVSTVTTLQAKGANPKDVDKDVTSAVIITEGASLQSLFNLLQNSKVTRAIAGPHANLPPTLIASKPFLYAQLLSLNKTSQVLKRQGHATEYVVELDGGPIMQHTVEMAVKFVRASNLVTNSEATLRVNDKIAYAGLNGIDQSNEWNELQVGQESFSWKQRA